MDSAPWRKKGVDSGENGTEDQWEVKGEGNWGQGPPERASRAMEAQVKKTTTKTLRESSDLLTTPRFIRPSGGLRSWGADLPLEKDPMSRFAYGSRSLAELPGTRAPLVRGTGEGAASMRSVQSPPWRPLACAQGLCELRAAFRTGWPRAGLGCPGRVRSRRCRVRTRVLHGGLGIGVPMVGSTCAGGSWCAFVPVFPVWMFTESSPHARTLGRHPLAVRVAGVHTCAGL